VKVFPTLLAITLGATCFHLQGQVLELQQTVVIPQTGVTHTLERRWAPGAVIEVPPIFATRTFELKRTAAEDAFTKYLERRLKRSYLYIWRWSAIHLELSRHPNESCTADYLTSEYREVVEQFDDLRFQFVVEEESEDFQ
jgi:hypothetical protein